jgi:hypothetical protein
MLLFFKFFVGLNPGTQERPPEFIDRFFMFCKLFLSFTQSEYCTTAIAWLHGLIPELSAFKYRSMVSYYMSPAWKKLGV